MNNRALTYEQVLWSYKRFKRGYTKKELAEILFVTPKTISRSFDYYGLKREHKPGRRCEDEWQKRKKK